MKRKIFSILFALVLVLSLSLVTAVPVAATSTVINIDTQETFATIQAAIDDDDTITGHTIEVGAGEWFGAVVTKAVEIKGEDRAVINDGPPHPAGLTMGFLLGAGSDGATISHLRFEDVDLVIMNGQAVDGVTVEHCTFIDSIQAISNWGGSGWTISHNEIIDLQTRNGGGIGILIADWTGGIVENNVVSHNKISGILRVGGWYDDPDDENGGYNGSGIVIFADFRWNADGAEEISNNRVVKNKVALVSDTPTVVDVVAFELTDTRDNEDLDPVLLDNAIGFNDFRGTELQIALTPENLDEVNTISRNLGDNRGHGLHPKLFR